MGSCILLSGAVGPLDEVQEDRDVETSVCDDHDP